MSLMLIILYYVYMATVIKVVADSVTFNHSDRISYKENSNDISDSIVSGSFNNSSASPRGGGQVLNDDHDVALGYSCTITNDVEENFQAPAGHNSTLHRFSGSQRERREGLGESSGNPPSFHSTEQPSQPQAASDARRPPSPFDASSTGIRPVHYPPKTPPRREQRASRGPLGVRHDPYGEHHVDDGAQHPSSSEVRSTDNKPRKKAQRPKKSRRTKAKTTQPTSHGPSPPFTPTHSRYYPKKARPSKYHNTHPTSNDPSRPSTPSHFLHESWSTPAPHSMHSPVTSHHLSTSPYSSSSCSCAGCQSSPPPNPSNHAPSSTPSPIPHGQYWAIPAHPDPHVTHMIATHYLPHPQPFHFLIAHPVHHTPMVLSHPPVPRFAPMSVAQPVRSPASFIQQPSESPFQPYYPDSDPNTPTRDTYYDHMSTAAIGSMHHPAAQTPSSSNLSQFAAHTPSWRHEGPSQMSMTHHSAAQTPSSSNLPQFAAHMPSWQHEGPSRMSMTPHEADSSLPMSPTRNHRRQRRTTRNTSNR